MQGQELPAQIPCSQAKIPELRKCPPLQLPSSNLLIIRDHAGFLITNGNLRDLTAAKVMTGEATRMSQLAAAAYLLE